MRNKNKFKFLVFVLGFILVLPFINAEEPIMSSACDSVSFVDSLQGFFVPLTFFGNGDITMPTICSNLRDFSDNCPGVSGCVNIGQEIIEGEPAYAWFNINDEAHYRISWCTKFLVEFWDNNVKVDTDEITTCFAYPFDTTCVSIPIHEHIDLTVGGHYIQIKIGDMYDNNKWVGSFYGNLYVASGIPPSTCSDSDGDDIYTKGVVEIQENSQSYFDYCASGTEVVERLCVDNALKSETRLCPEDHTCYDGKCIYNPTPEQHKECQGQSCVLVAGEGANECESYIDCIIETHTICTDDDRCITVSGSGTNECTSNADCGTPTYKSCNINNKCVEVQGTGFDECSTDTDCKGNNQTIYLMILIPIILIIFGGYMLLRRSKR